MFRRDFQQRLDRFACSIICELLQPIAQRKEKEQRRAFGPPLNEQRADRDCDHKELDVDLAALKRIPHILSRKPAAGEICQSEKRRNELAADPGAAEKKAREGARSANRGQQQHQAVITSDGRWEWTVSPRRQ